MDAAILDLDVPHPDPAVIASSSLGAGLAVRDADGLSLGRTVKWRLAGGAVYRVTLISAGDWSARAAATLAARVAGYDRLRPLGRDGEGLVFTSDREAVFVEALHDPAHHADYRFIAPGGWGGGVLIERLKVGTVSADAPPPGEVVGLRAAVSPLPGPVLSATWGAPLYGGVVVGWELQWRGRIDGTGQTSPWSSSGSRIIDSVPNPYNGRYRGSVSVSAAGFTGDDYRRSPWQVRVRGVDAAGNGRWVASPELT